LPVALRSFAAVGDNQSGVVPVRGRSLPDLHALVGVPGVGIGSAPGGASVKGRPCPRRRASGELVDAEVIPVATSITAFLIQVEESAAVGLMPLPRKAPEIEDLGGNLVDPEHRETEKAMEPGAYELNVKAFSAEGIAKIEVIANGNIQVDEKTCAEDFEKEGVECEHVSDPWITESGNWSPGILNLEVIVTDREGHEASERFWVNIPYTPPPDPEAEPDPTYTEIKNFREEFGLDPDLKGNEEAINERIFGLIRDWENPHTPAGKWRGQLEKASGFRCDRLMPRSWNTGKTTWIRRPPPFPSGST
jgi:hypothetical protein